MANAQPFEFEGIEVLAARPLFSSSDEAWIPFLVALKNHSTTARSVTVVLRSRVGSRAFPVEWEVELSPGGHKRQVLPSFRGRQRWGTTGQVELFEAGQRLVGNVTNSAIFYNLNNARRNRGSPAMSVLIVSSSAALATEVEFAYRQGSSNKAEFERISPESVPVLPDAYRAVDRLIFVGVSPRDLSAAQRRAVVRAVRSGLPAWIVPGKSGEGNGWTTEADLPAREVAIDGETTNLFIFDSVEQDPGALERTFVTDEGREYPAVFHYREGLGEWRRLTCAAFARIGFPEEGTARRRALELDPHLGDDDPSWQARQRDSARVGWWHGPLDDLYRPGSPLEWVFVLLSVYMLMIGPGLYWGLRRRGKLIWLLWLQPLIVIAFLAVIYVVGMLHFGAATVSYETLVVTPGSDSDWGVCVAAHTQYCASETSFDLRTGDGSLPVLLAAPRQMRSQTWRIDPHGGDRLSDFLFPTWSYHHFTTSGPLYLGGALNVEETIDADGLSLVTVRNNLPFAVRDPLYRGRFRFPRRIASGEEVTLAPDQALLPGLDPGGREGIWLDFQRAVRARLRSAETAVPALLTVSFDPDDLPADNTCSVEGQKRERRGVLVARVKGSP